MFNISKKIFSANWAIKIQVKSQVGTQVTWRTLASYIYAHHAAFGFPSFLCFKPPHNFLPPPLLPSRPQLLLLLLLLAASTILAAFWLLQSCDRQLLWQFLYKALQQVAGCWIPHTPQYSSPQPWLCSFQGPICKIYFLINRKFKSIIDSKILSTLFPLLSLEVCSLWDFSSFFTLPILEHFLCFLLNFEVEVFCSESFLCSSWNLIHTFKRIPEWLS